MKDNDSLLRSRAVGRVMGFQEGGRTFQVSWWWKILGSQGLVGSYLFRSNGVNCSCTTE